MLLRRVMEHVSAQNWTAVVLDFAIVVVGVFIGLQVSNWNESRAHDRHERELLAELRQEIEKSMQLTTGRQTYLEGVAAAANQSLAVIAADTPCAEDCWRHLVNFFHASQWSDVRVSRVTYAELRRLGFPRSRAVSSAVETYYNANDSLARVLDERAWRGP